MPWFPMVFLPSKPIFGGFLDPIFFGGRHLLVLRNLCDQFVIGFASCNVLRGVVPNPRSLGRVGGPKTLHLDLG